MPTPERPQCPVCHYAIAVRDGRFVEHTSPRPRTPGQSPARCVGGGQPRADA